MHLQNDSPQEYKGPGFVDLQLNGFAGFDFNGDWRRWTVGALLKVRAALMKCGVLAALPTFITDDASRMIERARTYARLIKEDERLMEIFPGLHIEGPFISPEEGPRGAHPLRYCRDPSELPALVDQLIEASGDGVKIVTLAPERKGALKLISRCAGAGIVAAIGHTNADAAAIKRAVDAGVRLSTHLGNGSHQVLPRHDNYLQHQLADDRLIASFIADGHHVPFPALKNFIRAKTMKRCVLVTDAISAAGKGAGVYSLGEAKVHVDESLKCQIPGQPNLAGSALTMDRAVLNVASDCDVSFEEAWEMASKMPAQLIRLPVPEDINVAVTRFGMRVLDN